MAARTIARPRHLPDHLLAEGVSWATTEDLAGRLGVEPTRVPDSLERARTAGRILSITKGAWLVVPPEYLRWSAPPPTHYVDAWMRHLGHPYYVGLRSAAAHPASPITPPTCSTSSPRPACATARSVARASTSFTRSTSRPGRRSPAQERSTSGRQEQRSAGVGGEWSGMGAV